MATNNKIWRFLGGTLGPYGDGMVAVIDGDDYMLRGGDTATGPITATRFISNQATGVAPFGVTSTTAVTNLNADMVDGLHSTSLIQTTGGTISSGALGFGSATRQMIDLFGTTYGLGVQSSTLYQRTGANFAWYVGGVHNNTAYNSGGGTELLRLSGTEFKYKGLAVATEPYIQSRLENLVTNGNGLLGNNYNFSVMTYNASERYTGGGSFEYNGVDASRLIDEIVPVDIGKRYKYSYAIKLLSKSEASETPTHYGMLAYYDADGLSIAANMVLKYPGSAQTTLAAALNPGATTISLTSSAGWYNGAVTSSKYIAFYPYTNAQGYSYPNYTYTRLVSGSDLWPSGGINATTHVITLNAPWAGASYAAGTPVANAVSGGGYDYIAGSNVATPTTWTKFEGFMGPKGGEAQYDPSVPFPANGHRSSLNGFWWGTAFVKVGWLLSYGTPVGTARTVVDAVTFETVPFDLNSDGAAELPGPLTLLGGNLGHLYMDNAALVRAKNTTGTYETALYPRWSNNALYLDGGTGGSYLRTSNGSVLNVQLKTDGVTQINGSESIVSTANGPQLRIENNAALYSNWIGWYDGATTRRGYVGFGSVGTGTTLALLNDSGQVTLQGTTAVTFVSNAAEAGRFDSAQRLLVGQTTFSYSTKGASLFPGGQVVSTIDSAGTYNFGGYHVGVADASGEYYARFFRTTSLSTIGSITQNGTTGVAFNTTSDQTLKDEFDLPEWSALDTLDALNFRWFRWKNAPSEVGFGLYAQEAWDVWPSMVSLPREPDSTWQIDYSRAVALVGRAVQELRAEVQRLSAKVKRLSKD